MSYLTYHAAGNAHTVLFLAIFHTHLSCWCLHVQVSRTYESLSVGCPASTSGRVLTNIDRDKSDRKRMAAYPYGGGRGRTAASNYTVLEQLAGGASALVQWRLETGRTHQIR